MIRRALALCALLVLGVVVTAPSASAHASLRSSEPAGGATVAASPDAVTITFSEQPEPSLSSIRVLDSGGTSHERGKPSPVAGDALTLRVATEQLDEGVYTVLWRVVSRVDGHATAGSFAFGIGVSPEGATPPPIDQQPVVPERSSLEMVGRSLLYAGIVSLIGGAWFAAFVLRRRGEPDPGERRMLAFIAAGWLASAIGMPLLAEAQRRAADTGFGDLAATSLGRALIWRAAALLIAGAAVAVAVNTRRNARRWALAASGVAAAVAAFVHVQAGHASATTNPGRQVASQWVHVIAVSVWVGGFGALLAAVRGAATPDRAGAVRRYSTTAAVAVFAVLATGVVRSLGELERLGDLTATGYGRALLIKIVVFIGLGVLGAVNRYRNVARARTTLAPLRRIVAGEAALAVVALVAASVLASLAPPSPANATRPAGADRITVAGSDFATTVRARVAIAPGYAGINDIRVTLADYDSGDRIDDAEVSIRFAHLGDASVPPSVTPLEAKGRGSYGARSTGLSLDGRWQLTVLVQRGSGSVEIPFTIATRCRVTPTPAEGQPTLYDATLPEGRTVQMYADTTSSGKSEIHVTLFDASGTETFVRSVAVTASRGDDDPAKLPHRRFTEGHFIATGDLADARWRFDIAIATPDGTYKTCFEETIGG